MAQTNIVRRFGWISAGAMTLLAGCARSNHFIPDAAPVQPAVFYQPAAAQTAIPEQLVERRPYRLSPGDLIEVMYHVRGDASDEPYRLQTDDRIRITFPYQPQFNQEVTVGDDGQVRCLLVGGLRAAGYSAADFELQLKERYKTHLKEPELTVTVEAAHSKIDALKQAITSAPRGQSRLVPIKPDGTIDLPYVGECHVAGRTVQEAKEQLDKKYAEADLAEVQVALQTLEFAPKRVFVGGEVNAPGVITAQGPISVLQALFQLGGVNNRGDARKIMLIRRKHLPVPEAICLDLAGFLEMPVAGSIEKFRHDIYLEDGDVLFVPPTELARANDWIDQVFTRGLRAVVPYGANVGVDFGYQIYNAPLTVQNHHRLGR